MALFFGGRIYMDPPRIRQLTTFKAWKKFFILVLLSFIYGVVRRPWKGTFDYDDQSVTTCEIMGYYFFYRKSSHNAHVRRKKLWSELRCLKLLVKFLLADTNCKDKVILIRLYVRSHCILWYGSVCSFTLPWTIYLGLSFLSSKISHLFLQNAQGQASQDNQKDSWF